MILTDIWISTPFLETAAWLTGPWSSVIWSSQRNSASSMKRDYITFLLSSSAKACKVVFCVQGYLLSWQWSVLNRWRNLLGVQARQWHGIPGGDGGGECPPVLHRVRQRVSPELQGPQHHGQQCPVEHLPPGCLYLLRLGVCCQNLEQNLQVSSEWVLWFDRTISFQGASPHFWPRYWCRGGVLVSILQHSLCCCHSGAYQIQRDLMVTVLVRMAKSMCMTSSIMSTSLSVSSKSFLARVGDWITSPSTRRTPSSLWVIALARSTLSSCLPTSGSKAGM